MMKEPSYGAQGLVPTKPETTFESQLNRFEKLNSESMAVLQRINILSRRIEPLPEENANKSQDPDRYEGLMPNLDRLLYKYSEIMSAMENQINRIEQII